MVSASQAFDFGDHDMDVDATFVDFAQVLSAEPISIDMDGEGIADITDVAITDYFIMA